MCADKNKQQFLNEFSSVLAIGGGRRCVGAERLQCREQQTKPGKKSDSLKTS